MLNNIPSVFVEQEEITSFLNFYSELSILEAI